MVQLELFMKRLIAIALVMSMAIPAIVWAEAPSTQPAPEKKQEDNRSGPRQGPGQRQNTRGMIERLNEVLRELNVSEEQQAQIDSILERARDDMQSLRKEMENSDLRPRERMARVRDTLRQYHEEIANVLNEEQRAAFREKVQSFINNAPGGMMLDRFENTIKQLEITPEQQSQIDAILVDAKAKLDELRKEAQGAGGEIRDKARTLMQDTRRKLGEVLTQEQKDKLQEMLPRFGGGPNGDRQRPDGPGDRPNKDNRNGNKPDSEKSTEEKPPADPQAGARPGDRAPDFALRKLDGLPVQLSSFEGKPLVIEFGSYSSPSFRDRAKLMEQLKRDLGTRVSFLVIYTKEAHAKDEWEVQRNKDDNIEVAQHANDEARKEAAENARDTLKITIPIALDTMDNAAATAYDGMSNAAVIIDRSGKIAYRQKWCDPVSLRRKLEELLKQPATQPA